MSYILFFLIVLLVMIFLIIKFIKKVVHMAISLIVLVILVLSLLTFLVYSDYDSFKHGADEKYSVVLVSDGETYIAGGYVNISNINQNQGDIRSIENISDFNTKSNKEILGDNYKLFIIDIGFFEENLPDYINYQQYTLSKRGVINVLRSSDPKSEFASTLRLKKEDIKQNPDQLKFELAMRSLQKIVELKGKLILVSSYKTNELTVYKETMLFKLIKIAPTTYINKYITN